MSTRLLRAATLVICVLAAGTLSAQSTSTKGSISGMVVDEGAIPLPGVAVVLSSTAMQETQTTVTDTNGGFRFVRLPPGAYKAVFSLSGFQKLEQEVVEVNIGESVRLDVTMPSAFKQEVVVTSETPLVNTTSTSIGVDLSEDFFLSLPTQRNYASLAGVTAGVGTDNAGPTGNNDGITVYGYSLAYNNWEYYLSRRGAFGRTDAELEADLHLGYPVKLGKDFELNLLVDVFNLLDRQGETGRNMQYDVSEDYLPLDWNTGLPNRAIVPGVPPGTPGGPTNAAFNTTNTWQAPRSIRLGARLSF
jgi:hypothetical protein